MIFPKTSQTREGIASHYDDLDGFYRGLWGTHVHHGLWETGAESPQDAVRKLVDSVARQARVHRGDLVCDVGCGYGETAWILHCDYGASVTGLTISKLQHQFAISRCRGIVLDDCNI